VDAGAILVRVDDRSSTLALQEAEAALALAKARLQLARSEVERHAPLLAQVPQLGGIFPEFLSVDFLECPERGGGGDRRARVVENSPLAPVGPREKLGRVPPQEPPTHRW